MKSASNSEKQRQGGGGHLLECIGKPRYPLGSVPERSTDPRNNGYWGCLFKDRETEICVMFPYLFNKCPSILGILLSWYRYHGIMVSIKTIVMAFHLSVLNTLALTKYLEFFPRIPILCHLSAFLQTSFSVKLQLNLLVLNPCWKLKIALIYIHKCIHPSLFSSLCHLNIDHQLHVACLLLMLQCEALMILHQWW